MQCHGQQPRSGSDAPVLTFAQRRGGAKTELHPVLPSRVCAQCRRRYQNARIAGSCHFMVTGFTKIGRVVRALHSDGNWYCFACWSAWETQQQQLALRSSKRTARTPPTEATEGDDSAELGIARTPPIEATKGDDGAEDVSVGAAIGDWNGAPSNTPEHMCRMETPEVPGNATLDLCSDGWELPLRISDLDWTLVDPSEADSSEGDLHCLLRGEFNEFNTPVQTPRSRGLSVTPAHSESSTNSFCLVDGPPRHHGILSLQSSL